MKKQAQKWEKRCSREKSIKNRFLAPLLGPRIDFWSILGTPRGPKNPPKEVTIIEEGHSWQLLWALQRIFLDFGSIFGQFWLHFGSPWLRFGAILVVVSFLFFLGGICFLGCWFVGLLCCWVLGFLSCWVAMFLGCWVIGWFGCLLVVGLLGCWVVGLVGWWVVGLLSWNVGLLVCCFVALLVCWSVGLLLHFGSPCCKKHEN